MKILESMKKTVVLMLAGTALIACIKDTDTNTDVDVDIDNDTATEIITDSEGWTSYGSPVGTWSLSSWNALSQAEVYLSFSEDGNFELYQRVYTPFYEYYSGTWQHSEGKLSGTYSDGVEWGAYYLAFRDDEMRLTHSADEEDIAYFVQSTIPNEVLEYGNPDSKALGDSESSTETRFLRNSGRLL